MSSSLSIILPVRNEAYGLRTLLPELQDQYPDAEIILVDDGSTDDTVNLSADFGVRVISHPYNKGNGAAIKTGARHAGGDTLVFMDSDGQHKPEDIQPLLQRLDEGYDMVVGARNWSSQANLGRGVANKLFNYLASWMVGHEVPDLTSGFRAVVADKFRDYLHMLPNGFSYPTTITMAFFRAGHSVSYVPINVRQRNSNSNSHISPVRDGLRFLLIIFRVGTLYSPLKLFVPISLFFFTLGTSYYLYTFINEHRFTNMSALLLITSLLVFLIGLVSEQITNLLFTKSNH